MSAPKPIPGYPDCKMTTPAEVIGEAVHRTIDTLNDFDEIGAAAIALLAEFGYEVRSIVREEPGPEDESLEHRCSPPSSVAGSGWWTCPECQRDWTVVSWRGSVNQPGVRRWMKVV